MRRHKPFLYSLSRFGRVFSVVVALLLMAFSVFQPLSPLVSAAPPLTGKPMSKKEREATVAWTNWVANICGPSGTTSSEDTGSGDVGSNLFVLGDSIMQIGYYNGGGLDTAFKDAGIKANVDAQGSRSITRPGQANNPINKKLSSGLEAVDLDKDYIQNASGIVVELGTNTDGTPAYYKDKLDQLVSKIRNINKDAPLYLVNIFSPSISDRSQRNQAIREVAEKNDAAVINVAAKNIATSDNVHPSPEGYKTYNQVVVDGLKGGEGESGAGGGTPGGSSFSNQEAQDTAKKAGRGSTKVGYALYDSTGKMVDSFNAGFKNYGASITKSMLLVAYLKQAGNGSLSSEAKSQLTNMIENSDNAAANWVYGHLNNGPTDVRGVAAGAGMTNFVLDTSDPVYILGQSQITADDFGKFFAKIDTMVPPSKKDFALDLLSNVSPKAGLLQAGLPGKVYSKEGWKPEPSGLEGAPYIVNQAAQFTSNGTTYGLAVTVGGTSDQASGEEIVKDVGTALVGSLGTSSGEDGSSGCCPTGGGGGTPAVSGSVSAGAGKGMSPEAQKKFQEYLVAAGKKFDVNPNFIAAFYYAEMGRTGDSTNNADSASGTPATGDGNWIEPAPPVGHGDSYVVNSGGYAEPMGWGSYWSAYGQDGDGDGKEDRQNLADALFGTANVLATNGAKNGASNEKLKDAAFLYNHSDTYVQSVMNTYNYLQGKGNTEVSSSGSSGCASATGSPDCATAVNNAKILCEARKYKDIYYLWGGGHIPYSTFRKNCPIESLADAASKSTAGDPGPCAVDCSGLVSVAVNAAFNQDFTWIVSETGDNMVGAGAEHWKKVPFGQAQAGDIATKPGHVEIVDHYDPSSRALTTFGAHQTGVKTGLVTTTDYFTSIYRYDGPTN